MCDVHWIRQFVLIHLFVDKRRYNAEIRVVLRGARAPGGLLSIVRDFLRYSWLEAARVMKIGANNINMLKIIRSKPYVDRL